MKHIAQCVKQLKAYRGFLPVYLEDELFEKAEKELTDIEQKIDEACEAQREECAKAYMKSSYWNHPAHDIILNAPLPKESEL